MKTTQVLQLMKVVSWFVFIGFCIEVGAILVTTTISIFHNPEAAENLYLGLNLSNLYNFSTQNYIYVISFIIAIAASKAYLFWLVIKMLNKVNVTHPFTLDVSKIISKIAYLALSTGILAIVAASYSKGLWKNGATFDLDWGSQEFLFMAGILYVFAFIFKRGVELQEENDLTI